MFKRSAALSTELKQRQEFTVSTAPTIYGCCGLFDLCSDEDLMSLSFQGTTKFLDWIGWELTDVCEIRKNFITWVRPEPTVARGDIRSSGRQTDPCGNSNGVDWGFCDFLLDDFGRLRRHGPVRDATRASLRLCEKQPRYRLDGTVITSDAEYDMRLAVEGLMQDLKQEVVIGTDGVVGSFDGLEQLVRTGYTDSQGHLCQLMDSIVVDWNGNGMAGGAGITWNGAATPAGHDFVDFLLAIFRRIRDRINMAPQLSSQVMQVGDIVLVAPSHTLRCILDAFTCWSVCPGTEFNETNLNTYEARTFRDRLSGGMFGFGKIFLDGFEIPLIAYDWGLVKGPTLADVYILTGSIGSVKTISGQMNDLRNAPSDYPEAGYRYTDGGRLLTWVNADQTCVQREVEMQPRLLMWAPWAQARIQDVRCVALGGVLSPDPWETSFFPETSFLVPACPV